MKRICIALLFCLPFSLHAQQDDPALFLSEQLEELMPEEGYGWENELEELSMRMQEPINLNTATKGQLEQLPFLTDRQVEELIAYITLKGEMQTLYELQLVKEMNRQTIELLLPFVCVKPVERKQGFPSLKQLAKYGKHEAQVRLDIPFYTREGYKESYLGPPLYHSLRYKFHYGDHLQAGITAEKDAGEPMFARHNAKGYDYYSPYLLIRDMGRLKALALGNYRLNFGQGLVLNSGFLMGKTFSLTGKNFRPTGIRKHSSTDESNYFRGIAATVEVIPSLQLSAFYSHRTLDGVIKEGEITSIYKTGLHRSQAEADKRNRLTQQLAGGNITFRKGALQVGATGIYHFFDRTYHPRLNGYAKYNLRGKEFYNIGIDYRLALGRFLLAGEAAKGTKGHALLNQLSYRLSSNYQLLLVHRLYAHDYWAYFANSFGEGGTPQNENGWYLAAEATPIRHWRFFASIDLFSSPWWKYRISKPSQGVDIRLQATYTPREELTMYLNYRYKQKERDISGSDPKETLPTYHHRTRFRLQYTPGAWMLRTTLDHTAFSQTSVSHGFQLTQSAAYTFPFRLRATAQASYFHAADYDSRLYINEPALMNTFYSPSYYGRGFRLTAHLRYDLSDRLMLLVKLGHTHYRNRNEISSGDDLIKSNRKTDLQMQVRVKF